MMFVYTIGLVLIALGVILLWARWADRDTDEFISLSRPFSLFLAVLFILAMTSISYVSYNRGHDEGVAEYFVPSMCDG